MALTDHPPITTGLVPDGNIMSLQDIHMNMYYRTQRIQINEVPHVHQKSKSCDQFLLTLHSS